MTKDVAQRTPDEIVEQPHRAWSWSGAGWEATAAVRKQPELEVPPAVPTPQAAPLRRRWTAASVLALVGCAVIAVSALIALVAPPWWSLPVALLGVVFSATAVAVDIISDVREQR